MQVKPEDKTMYQMGMMVETAKKCRLVAKHHGNGDSIATACARAGISQQWYYKMRETYESAERWHKHALKRRADAVAQAVFELSTGKAMKKKTVYSFKADDAGDVVRTLDAEIEEVLPPDATAAKYYLNNVAPEDWKDKVEIQSDGMQYQPLVINVQSSQIAEKRTIVDTDAKSVKVNL